MDFQKSVGDPTLTVHCPNLFCNLSQKSQKQLPVSFGSVLLLSFLNIYILNTKPCDFAPVSRSVRG